MKSLTKIDVDNKTLKQIFLNAGLGEASEIVPLTAGEFNSVFLCTIGSNKYVIKIAPHTDTPVLYFEKNKNTNGRTGAKK